MRHYRVRATLTALLTVLLAVAARAQSPIFLLDSDINVSNLLFRVNPATGQLTPIGSIATTFGDAVGLAAVDHDTLYVTTGGARLLRVTVSPFAVADLGPLGGYFPGLAYYGGDLFGIDEVTDGLYRIDTTPPNAVLVGTVREGSPAGPVLDLDGADIAPDAAGTWYLWTNATNDLYLLDVTTAVATRLDPPTTGAPKTGLAFDYLGGNRLYTSTRTLDVLETLDPTTGSTTASIAFCLFCPTPYDHRFGDLASPRCTDVDGDGFSPEGGICGTADCNDANPAVFPGATERCNGVDDDCDAAADEEPAASASCATACTATATCVAAVCVTTPVVCNDGNPCTADSCDPALGCRFVNHPDGLSCSDGDVCTGQELCQGGTCTNAPDLDCNDGNPCTVDSCATPNGCRNTPVPGCCTTNADCVDASLCTVNERCAGGQCLSDPVDCNDGNPCTSDACNPATGCGNVPVVNGVPCSDGDACDGLETCLGGICAPGTPLDCNDGNACTVDGCSALAGCTQQPTPGCCASDADCADVSACTVNERCVANACASDPRPCDDGNPCTADACNPASGCVFTPVPNGQSCSDLDFCNGMETCQSGTCVPMAVPDCNDGNACTTDTCNAVAGCRNTPVPGCCTANADCADASLCTANERCVAGQCVSDPVDCNDGNPCTGDTCSPSGGCANVAVVDGVSCSDGDTCNGLETCQGGACRPGLALACDDGNACTADACNSLSGCTHQPTPGCCDGDADCADVSACTINERCVGNACVSDPRPCTDGNPCTADACNPASGCVFTPVPNGQSCSDLDFCNGMETCQTGTCVATAVPDCNDGNPCTVDGCNSVTGCTHAAVPECCFTDGDCVDADACTVDERCVGGSCTSEPRNCLDGNPCTVDTCDPVGGCRNQALLDGTSCSDGNACDGSETCAGGSCREGAPPNCDDVNFCTRDSCDNAAGCQHEPVEDCCNGNVECADVDQCTQNERCTAQHACVSDPRPCDDGNPCTGDACDPDAGCQFLPLSSGACDDGDACTGGDACAAGSCVGTPAVCSDGNLCNGLETCVPGTGACTPFAGPLSCTPGSRRADRTCAAEWHVENPGNPEGVLATRQYCQQGDPSCDFDAAAETCTFRLAVCLRVPDPRLIPACPASDVASWALRRPSLVKDPTTAQRLLDALAALPGATIGGRRGQDVTFTPPLDATRCTVPAAIPVPAGGQVVIRARARTVAGAVDSDLLQLRCLGG
jgi:hypothetical protein